MSKSASEWKRRSESSRAGRFKRRSLEISQGRCYWCQQPVVDVSVIPFERRIEETENRTKIRFLDHQGREVVTLKASLDHLRRLRDGGLSIPSNLVTACIPCNWARNDHDQSRDPERSLITRKWVVRCSGANCDHVLFLGHKLDARFELGPAIEAAGWSVLSMNSLGQPIDARCPQCDGLPLTPPPAPPQDS